jgi:hypothetical protein
MLRMVSYPRRLKSGQIMCYLNRTYHVLTTLSGFSVDLDRLARHNPHRFGGATRSHVQALFPDSPRLIGPFQAIPQRIRFANGWLSDGIEIGDRSGNNAKKEDYL